MVDDPQQLSNAMSLGTAVSLALRPFQEVILPEDFVVFDDRKDDLIQGFSKIFGNLPRNSGMLGPVLARLMLIGSHARKFYDLCSICVVTYIS